ncbi:hypothetical protein MNEG_14953 [Monoraphidium neglectum]|uniref:Acylamino-acid-releasing enzyme N-terminal domain-containing protein n=1 Tax=Monoraphidium neglectum TaxID=145388 RepID=A0A0D2MCM2_9CHLO|nr:hypothetical protein MNEG_14953 [Monoraphidium neglectum]KIY93010.1 hypothetical protein MNEG_14953 [Monoraphidium neglectum]|eukprot:XP_013892030.1 hypothetical protein MNEG_14953 [Monoraphidium neglectum]
MQDILSPAAEPQHARFHRQTILPPPEKTPQWGGADAKDAAAPRGWRGVAAAQEDWGELNTGKGAPALFVLDAGGWTVTKLAGLPEDHSCGQPVWTPDGAGLVFVAWPHAPLNFPATKRRLGIVFCYNRPCSLFHAPYAPPPAASKDAEPDAGAADAAAEAAPAEDLTGGQLLSAFAPVFSPEGGRLVFLSQDAAARSGVHSGTVSLHSLGWPSSEGGPAAKTVVPVIARPASPGSFPGLYAGGFPEAAFLSERVVLVNSQWYSQGVALAVDLETGAVAPVTPLGAEHGSWTVQGVCNGVIAAVASRPSSLPELLLAAAPLDLSAPAADAGSPLDLLAAAAALSAPSAWRPVAELAVADLAASLPDAAAAVEGVEAVLMEIKPTTGDKTLTFQSVVQAPKDRSGPCPVIVFPHGGPHTAVAANYYMPFAFLTRLGYCVVAVNYR